GVYRRRNRRTAARGCRWHPHDGIDHQQPRFAGCDGSSDRLERRSDCLDRHTFRTLSRRRELPRSGAAVTATDMTTDMPAGENAEKVTERELLPIAGGRQTWKWLRAALAEHRMQSLLVLIVAASASAMALVPIYVFGVLVDRV